ncbi:hypothetical protein PDE_02313 [Penicillium oxalicum 114-2]|uniref:AAA+ ATPase domain-containing protein n=1 Tax=Penicillium oxalicum (strain 114-2 / CGMCC 5302) TaxID=933388 RepID=S7Z9X6_PENO1|nr:hypothetical protein PDE_02313 [Penicillium oxalicum 114-2]
MKSRSGERRASPTRSTIRNLAPLSGEIKPTREEDWVPLKWTSLPSSPEARVTSYQHLTITDDQSEGSDIKRRKLMAVASGENGPVTSSDNSEGDQLPNSYYLHSYPEIPGEELRRKPGTRPLKSRPWLMGSISQSKDGEGVRLKVSLDESLSRPIDMQTEASKGPAAANLRWPDLAKESPSSPPPKESHSSAASEAPNESQLAGSKREAIQILSKNQKLLDRIVELESQLESLANGEQGHPARFKVLYCLYEEVQNPADDYDKSPSHLDRTLFEDEPEMTPNGENTARLRCRNRINNLELYLLKNPGIAFVVLRTYPEILHLEAPIGPRYSKSTDHLNLPPPSTEFILPVEVALRQGLEAILRRKPEFKDILAEYTMNCRVLAPYLFVYHSREDMEEIQSILTTEAFEQIRLFLVYVERALGKDFEMADSLLEKGTITPQYLQYLFKPGDVLVQKSAEFFTGFVAQSWLTLRPEHYCKSTVPRQDNFGSSMSPLTSSMSSAIHHLGMDPKNTTKERPSSLEDWIDSQSRQSRENLICEFSGKTLQFNGSFAWKREQLKIEFPANSWDKIIPIADLNIFPLRHAPESIFKLLQKRGSTFWKCRKKSLITYQPGNDDKSHKPTADRYMIDMDTFRTLHPQNQASRDVSTQKLSLDVIRDDARFQYLFPSQIKGFNLRRKVWSDLAVDCISDVEWNREAFHSLVIDPKAKNLIEALVVSQLEEEKSTDLISGKGSGLILLFHGGPGTGKTLTAEGVAEIAQKPLYRVTCGDVGTKPEEVEKYLDSVLHLGRIWDCVVLLDEADVFLEQRSLEDLQRNALVSVFLRVLEYYEGILILTSNRVGTFDEAFISRIQLAIHYPELGANQRHQIWQIFIDRLENLKEDIDFENLRQNLNALKQIKLNGRQIRNIITTTRQYAKWKKTTLTYEHLRDVIEISARFGTYLHDLRGFSESELAKDGGIR